MTVAAEELRRVGLRVTPEIVARYFTGRRPTDMFAEIEAATGVKLPHRICRPRGARHAEAAAGRTAHHAACPACADLAARAERRGVILAVRPRAREPRMHGSAALLRAECVLGQRCRGRQAGARLFLHAAGARATKPADCIVVEDSPAGVAAAVAAGMTAIGFVGGGHAALSLGWATDGGRREDGDRRHARAQGRGGRVCAGIRCDPALESNQPLTFGLVLRGAGAASAAGPSDRSRHREHRPRAGPCRASGRSCPLRYA